MTAPPEQSNQKPAIENRKLPDRVLLSHDWLTGMRGGERVLEVLCRIFPNAPIYTLLHNPAAVSEVIAAHPVTASWLQRVPGISRHYRYFLPLFPGAIERLHPKAADLLISTSHCVAKGLRPPKGAKHLCYCFTPMRYAWLFYEEYFGRNPLKKMALTPCLDRLRAWDRATCDRVDRFVALSRHVRKRILEFYGRESDVVYPPVNTEFWTPSPDQRSEIGNRQSTIGDQQCIRVSGAYDLIVSALVPYKKIELAVRAYNRLGYPLKIAGAGTELKRLQRLAGARIEFLGRVDDGRIRDLYRHCRLLVFPGVEDFGIVPVEAQACGRPVVAYGAGGALETVVAGQTGVFFHAQTEGALLEAVEQAAATKWDPLAIRTNAERFGEADFISGLTASIVRCMGT
ncbi:MAG: glycosyltransferase [Kiritimatiellia bacterium]|jgi:glycosyltransferase involved in cell wall biosynthesis